uniref:Type II secretion system protein n=1 Tax=candidate division CPR3 bacterium TaxID=2268181 RepID=A0A7V3N5P4_UNCC3
MFSKRLERLERPRQSVSEGGGWNGWNSKTFGFTLIEILVASFIFVVAVLATFSAFYSTTSFQAKTKVVRETTQEARNVVETLTREIRLADGVELSGIPKSVEDILGGCVPPSVEPPKQCPGIAITKDNQKKYYYLDKTNHKILLREESNGQLSGQSSDVTSDNVDVEYFQVSQDSNGWTIILTIKEKQVAKMAEKGVITLKTTVYRRGYQ